MTRGLLADHVQAIHRVANTHRMGCACHVALWCDRSWPQACLYGQAVAARVRLRPGDAMITVHVQPTCGNGGQHG